MIFNSFQFLYMFPMIFAGYYGLSHIIGKQEQGGGSNILLLLMPSCICSGMPIIRWCCFG